MGVTLVLGAAAGGRVKCERRRPPEELQTPAFCIPRPGTHTYGLAANATIRECFDGGGVSTGGGAVLHPWRGSPPGVCEVSQRSRLQRTEGRMVLLTEVEDS